MHASTRKATPTRTPTMTTSTAPSTITSSSITSSSRSRRFGRRARASLAFGAVAALALGACGEYGDSSSSAQPPPAEEQAASPSGSSVTVATASSPLGDILVDGDGMTLYGFMDDVDGVPTCADECSATWPAHLVDGDPVVGEGLDPAVFTLVDAVDGGSQLAAGPWPLYRFAGDSAPGDVNGQGSGGVWFAVAPDGSLVTGDPSAADTTDDATTDTSAPDEGGSDDTGADDGGWDDGGYGY